MSDMVSPTGLEILYGRDEPLSPATVLRAGQVEAALGAEGDLRRLRIGEIEIVRRIFITVRDKDWLEIQPRLSALSVESGDSAFSVGFTAAHESADLSLALEASIKGDESGSITYVIDAVAERAFTYCRIGFCVLHPPSCAGRDFRAETRNGSVIGRLPQRIGVQGYDNGVYRGLFEAFDRLEIQQGPDLEIGFAFKGDLFEMEDQRNWTDGSFKTYCTPMYLGYPFEASAGQRFHQRLTVTPKVPSVARLAVSEARRPAILIGEPLGLGLPRLGVSLSEQELAAGEAELLGALDLDHLKVAVELGDSAAADRLLRAGREAKALGCSLELAVFVSDEAGGGIHRIAAGLAELDVPVARVLVFRSGEETTSAVSMELARRELAPLLPGVPLCGGTNLYFTEINRTRPDLASVDGVSWTINPQIHAYDEASLVKTLEIQGETVRSAREFCGDRPLIVSGVTLKPPFNNDAMDEDGRQVETQPGRLPPSVDVRQMSLFGAAWTLGSVKYLAESGVSSVTYYETTGWRGLIETSAGSDAAAGFPSFPGMVFPIYHVVADVLELRGGALLSAESSDPLRVVALACRREPTVSVLVANLEPREQDVSIAGLPAGDAKARYLDGNSAGLAANEPGRFRSTWSEEGLPIRGSSLDLRLRPYSVVRLELGRTA